MSKIKAVRDVFKQKTEILSGTKTVFASPYCRQRTNEISAYLKASPEERKSLDWLAEQH